MIFIILIISFLIAVWHWGVWRDWQKYHSTILYFLLANLFYFFLTKNYPLWQHQPLFPFQSYVGVEICTMVCFVCTTLLFLGLYPNGFGKAIIWNGVWIILYSVIEIVFLVFGAIKHFNEWNMLYSVLFNILTFPMLRLHAKHPLLTYMISIPAVIALIYFAGVPIE